jgi:hypothetical protein
MPYGLDLRADYATSPLARAACWRLIDWKIKVLITRLSSRGSLRGAAAARDGEKKNEKFNVGSCANFVRIRPASGSIGRSAKLSPYSQMSTFSSVDRQFSIHKLLSVISVDMPLK